MLLGTSRDVCQKMGIKSPRGPRPRQSENPKDSDHATEFEAKDGLIGQESAKKDKSGAAGLRLRHHFVE